MTSKDEFFELIQANSQNDKDFSKLVNLSAGYFEPHPVDSQLEPDIEAEDGTPVFQIIGLSGGKVMVQKSPDIDNETLADVLGQIAESLESMDDDDD